VRREETISLGGAEYRVGLREKMVIRLEKGEKKKGEGTSVAWEAYRQTVHFLLVRKGEKRRIHLLDLRQGEKRGSYAGLVTPLLGVGGGEGKKGDHNAYVRHLKTLADGSHAARLDYRSREGGGRKGGRADRLTCRLQEKGGEGKTLLDKLSRSGRWYHWSTMSAGGEEKKECSSAQFTFRKGGRKQRERLRVWSTTGGPISRTFLGRGEKKEKRRKKGRGTCRVGWLEPGAEN